MTEGQVVGLKYVGKVRVDRVEQDEKGGVGVMTVNRYLFADRYIDCLLAYYIDLLDNLLANAIVYIYQYNIICRLSVCMSFCLSVCRKRDQYRCDGHLSLRCDKTQEHHPVGALPHSCARYGQFTSLLFSSLLLFASLCFTCSLHLLFSYAVHISLVVSCSVCLSSLSVCLSIVL
jgi:hypothetical protein